MSINVMSINTRKCITRNFLVERKELFRQPNTLLHVASKKLITSRYHDNQLVLISPEMNPDKSDCVRVARRLCLISSRRIIATWKRGLDGPCPFKQRSSTMAHYEAGESPPYSYVNEKRIKYISTER